MKEMNIRFPDHVYERMKEQCKREGRSFNGAVIQSVVEYLVNKGYCLDHLEDMTDKKENKKEA